MKLRLFAAAAVMTIVGNALAEDVVLRLHHFLPAPAVAQAQFLEPWAAKVMADSDERIRIDIYPAMQLGGKPPQLIDQVRDGVVDMVWTVPSYTPGRFPNMEVFELPFMAASAEATSQAVMAYSQANLDDSFAGIKPILFHVHAPGSIHTRGRPITVLEDLQGVKLRTPTRSITQTLEAYGAVPVGMPAPQVPQAIARGVVDGTVFPYEITSPLRIHEITDTHTKIFTDRGLYTVVLLLAINQRRYDSLPDDLKAVLDANSGMPLAAHIGRVWDQAETPGIAAAEALGDRFVELDVAEVERWKAAAQPVIEDWVAQRGAGGRALLAEARALVAQYAD
ncbi:MAG: TRAP transporter substrate-binding protein [Alphaproteobacteria bacterium]|jgi:TRAP-type C4-dicarboxylate transport system substrate-binding protein|nr:TRAP transporter substrate-binding protein [Alphaproteobacteria bacterium]MDP6239258.1 TRAP transporter substrate-binding protein [Alphaproteobacteria bacterium]MDP7172465.1 TRAP transporter substrate-binding protein [Alphaproteobacteria bacterium]MDP7233648.1 TRAP transporter substrate-binding protein [Alphaproteobacteria bacterium]|tara:strand:+ start:4490 stop:5500 length:1011 start_codon:yes stop_codon:yes gene_type:complete